MRISKLIWAILASLVLSACCAPDRCAIARSRFEVLDPVISQLLIFEGQNGRLPESLEEAFPDGLPVGIKPFPNVAGAYEFTGESDNFPTFNYGLYSAIKGQKPTATLQFWYVGGGRLLTGMNVCNWTEGRREWSCSSYM